jgi:hypothetical protein
MQTAGVVRLIQIGVIVILTATLLKPVMDYHILSAGFIGYSRFVVLAVPFCHTKVAVFWVAYCLPYQ